MNNEKNEVSNENALVASVERYTKAEKAIRDIHFAMNAAACGVKPVMPKQENEFASDVIGGIIKNFETISNKKLWKW